MDPRERTEFATSFGAIAETYDRYRPGPPAEAVAWLLPAAAGTVVDIGAGTGALTRLLVARAAHVVAIEPDARMRAVLIGHLPAVDAREGSAEHLPLADASVDAVLGSSMWHWVDEERAVPEIARVLRPGGVLGVLWSGPDRTEPWVAELLAREPLRARDPERRRRRELVIPAGVPFAAPEMHVIRWSRPVTVDDVIGLAATYSPVITLPAAEREELLDALADRVRNSPAWDGRETIDLPMICLCRRAVRQ